MSNETQLGRKPHADKPVKWTLSVPQSVSDKTDLWTLDPVTGSPAYGARSKLVTGLLRQYFNEVEGKHGEIETKLTDHLRSKGSALTDEQLLQILDRLMEASPYPSATRLVIDQLETRLAR